MTRPFPIQVFDVLGSTNDSILELGATDAPEGTTHVARAQTRGRGRADHAWWSPPGAGLWMSTLLRPTRARAHWGGLSLVAGRAVRDGLSELGVPSVALYWPNDLQVEGRKIGGILGEVRARGDRAWVALGVGINIDLTSAEVRASMPPELRGLATSMVECGRPRTRDPLEIARAILESLFALYERFEAGEAVPDLVGEGLAHVGSLVTVRAPGRAAIRGTVEGLGPQGELLVREPRREAPTVVTAGEVVYEAVP